MLFHGAAANPTRFPVTDVSLEGGNAIEDLLVGSEIKFLMARALQDLSSRNVIAEKRNPGEVLVLGRHYGSISEVSEAIDNGLGAALLLAISENLSDDDLAFALRSLPSDLGRWVCCAANSTSIP